MSSTDTAASGNPPVEPPIVDVPDWPTAGAERVVFLLDVASGFEQRLLRRWIEQMRPAEAAGRDLIEMLRIPCSRRSHGNIDPRLEPALAARDDPVLAPLRVAWFPAERDGQRSVRFSDLWKLGDPRDPSRLRARWIRALSPDRCRIVVGAPAHASELRARWQRMAQTHGTTMGFAEFVARQAALTLERGERELRGARYKVPRFVHDEVLSRPALRGELGHLAATAGRSSGWGLRKASRYLREIAASHSPFVIDLVLQLWRHSITRDYDEVLCYDPAQIEQLRVLSQQHPVVFLPSHKSNLDHPVLQLLLHEHGFPPNHTAGGINMNFFPIGALVRRSGIFFIRRSFKDMPVYKAVLRHYTDYLIEKRFPLEWYIEGGRSRSGKLLPPRFGMLAYVVDAYLRGRSEDVYLIPVSICYDQITDIGDYTAELHGGVKQKENFGWFLGLFTGLPRSYGKIFIRFGEPLSLAQTLGAPDPGAEPNPDEQNLELQKIAFETCVRINRVTPITPVSLVCLALLGYGDRAVSVEETAAALKSLVIYTKRRRLMLADPLNPRDPEAVRAILELLTSGGLLRRFDAGPEAVYRIADDQHLAAAYYRNTVIHYFVNGAIAELALVLAAEKFHEDRQRVFWDEAMRLRDLLKFEFFFADKDSFREELQRELALHNSPRMDWQRALEQGPDAILRFLRQIRPLNAHRILRPYLEAYRVVSEVLCRQPVEEGVVENRFLESCRFLGTQYVLQQRVKRQESVSKVLFATALKLARNRGLVESGTEGLADRRRGFAEEIQKAIQAVDAVEVVVRAGDVGVFE